MVADPAQVNAATLVGAVKGAGYDAEVAETTLADRRHDLRLLRRSGREVSQEASGRGRCQRQPGDRKGRRQLRAEDADAGQDRRGGGRGRLHGDAGRRREGRGRGPQGRRAHGAAPRPHLRRRLHRSAVRHRHGQDAAGPRRRDDVASARARLDVDRVPAGDAGAVLCRLALLPHRLGRAAAFQPGHEQPGHAGQLGRLFLFAAGADRAADLPRRHGDDLFRGRWRDRHADPSRPLPGSDRQGADLAGDQAPDAIAGEDRPRHARRRRNRNPHRAGGVGRHRPRAPGRTRCRSMAWSPKAPATSTNRC